MSEEDSQVVTVGTEISEELRKLRLVAEAARERERAEKVLADWELSHNYVMNSEGDALSGDVSAAAEALRVALFGLDTVVDGADLSQPKMVEFPLRDFHIRCALYAANRDVLWPVGLALTVLRDGDDYQRLYVTEWDMGNGQVEVIEGSDVDLDAEWEKFVAERRSKMSDADRDASVEALDLQAADLQAADLLDALDERNVQSRGDFERWLKIEYPIGEIIHCARCGKSAQGPGDGTCWPCAVAYRDEIIEETDESARRSPRVGLREALFNQASDENFSPGFRRGIEFSAAYVGAWDSASGDDHVKRRSRSLASGSIASLDEWPDRAWLISHWVGHRCEMVGCRTTTPHEHGGGHAMREMTAEERAASAVSE